MTIGAAALTRIGCTPEARVRWLLAFAARDLARLSASARRGVWDALFALQSQQPVRPPPHPETVAETQETLRASIDALANGRPYNLWVPGMSWTLRPPAPRPAGTRRSAPIMRESVESKIMHAAMPAMVVLAFVDDLNIIGADRLRACPLCGVVFLATRRQRYCGRRHAQAAAWQAYSIKRKLRRKR
jgi:ribosomal protein S27AE